jgi:pimeloyl-ACP methyl ester carboxylesterase
MANTPFRETRRIETDADLTLFCAVAGRGATPIIFIPGWSMNADVFERQLVHFSESERFQAVAYDPRGQGRSSKPLAGHYYAQRGRDLAQLIEALKLTDVVLAGWSYGVLDALAYVSEFGAANVRAAVLIDGAPRGLGIDPRREWVWESPEQHIAGNSVLKTLQNRASVTAGLAKFCLETRDPEERRWLERISELTPDTIAALSNEAAIYADYEADLVNLCRERPVSFIAREDWREVVTGWVAANAPSAELAILGKHMMFWDRAAQFNVMLDRFLGRIVK